MCLSFKITTNKRHEIMIARYSSESNSQPSNTDLKEQPEARKERKGSCAWKPEPVVCYSLLWSSLLTWGWLLATATSPSSLSTSCSLSSRLSNWAVFVITDKTKETSLGQDANKTPGRPKFGLHTKPETDSILIKQRSGNTPVRATAQLDFRNSNH